MSVRTYGFWKSTRVVFAALSILFLSLAANPAAAQSEAPATHLIRFNPETTAAEQQAALDLLGMVAVRWLPQANVVEAAPRHDGAVIASAALAAVAPYVQYIEPGAVVTGDLAPNDTAFAVPSQVYGQTLVQAPRAWDLSTGSDQTIIAILDSGINASHPEFANRVLPGYDFISDDDDPVDDHGHGTHVAGIAAAAVNNNEGIAGICPECMILPVKVLDNENKGTWGTVAAGIYYAVDNGARVINLSLGATITSTTLVNAITYAEEHDVIVVASAGNAGNDTPYYPAALPYVVAVGAVTDMDTRWILSSMGDHLDVAAPGSRIYSTYHKLDVNGGYASMSGTSMASPFVTGLLGLLASFDPALTGAELIDLMTANADDLGAEGKDPEYGFGRINVYKAMVAANGGVEPEPIGQDPGDPGDTETPDPQSASLFLPFVSGS